APANSTAPATSTSGGTPTSTPTSTANPAPNPVSANSTANSTSGGTPTSTHTPAPANPAPPNPAPANPIPSTPEPSDERDPPRPIVQPAVEVKLPEDAPDWLQKALPYLAARDLGCHYTSLLKTLVRLEESQGFEKEHPGLPKSKKRPKEVGVWIRGARGIKMKSLPTVDNVVAYGDQWYSWWDELQPAWRQRGEDGRLITGGKYGTEWGHLDCAGQNGNISIVAALYFWGAAAMHTEETRAVWNDAVEDVCWMLEGLDMLFE
ncbi:hypothetical protein DFH06DRAFT_984501, partial [Mycena polygramma]